MAIKKINTLQQVRRLAVAELTLVKISIIMRDNGTLDDVREIMQEHAKKRKEMVNEGQ